MEVSNRSRGGATKVWGRGLALPFISDRVLRTKGVSRQPDQTVHGELPDSVVRWV